MEKANNANEMSNEVKKFSLKNVEDFLSDNELKNTRGGSITYPHTECVPLCQTDGGCIGDFWGDMGHCYFQTFDLMGNPIKVDGYCKVGFEECCAQILE